MRTSLVAITEQVAARISRTYGEPFLRYVFALPPEAPIVEFLTTTGGEVVTLLHSAMDQAPYSGGGDIDITMMASGYFGRYDEALGESLAVHLHRRAGGDVRQVPAGTDLVVQTIRDIAHDVWPPLLLVPQTRGPRAFWMSSMAGVFSHPRTVDACRAFLADPELSKLFPGAPSIQEATAVDRTVLSVQANWMMSTGQGGSRQLISVIDAIIFSASVLAQLDGSPLDHDGLMLAIPRAVDTFRALATMKSVEVPALIGFAGVAIGADTALKFDHDELRPARPIEKNLLLTEADRVTSVFATKFPIQLLEVEAFEPGGDPDRFPKLWDKHAEPSPVSCRFYAGASTGGAGVVMSA